MAIILGANTLSAAYDVANSCRFQDSDSSEMSRAIASTGSNTTWTVSAWVKRVELGQSSPIFGTGDGGANNDARMVFFDADDKIECSYYNSGFTYEVTTNRLFRDVSAWYHICILFDTTESTEANRIKIYVNGTQETSFATSSYPSEDAAFNFGNTSYTHYVNDMGGRNIRGSHYIAELVYIDGTASAVTNFGKFDSDTPTVWKPIDVSGLSVGTNGVYLDFEASDNLGNAVDGGTDFTESNLDAQNQTQDTPTNNFCILNPLENYFPGHTFLEGNLQTQSTTSNKAWVMGTFGLSAGKWYWEAKLTASGGTHASDNWNMIGISNVPPLSATDDLGGDAGQVTIYQHDGKKYVNAASDATYAAAWATNDIIGVALDCDNNKIYFSMGGEWATGSGAWDSTTFDSGVGDIDITAPASTVNGFYFPVWGDGGVNVNKTWQFNFGNPVHSLSSANQDGDGYGNFEYAVPSGYYSICSKNLGAYGG